MKLNQYSYRRKNILTDEWVLVSPERGNRPWQGKNAKSKAIQKKEYDPNCYLCPGNIRVGGKVQNPKYKDIFIFENDFPAFRMNIPNYSINESGLLLSETEGGICKVMTFSANHNQSLSEIGIDQVVRVINIWREEYIKLGKIEGINSVQIFENKGALVGSGNPHPHCQIWAQNSIPSKLKTEIIQFKNYFNTNKQSILSAYINLEKTKGKRIILENEYFIVIVPFWATWPFETLLISKRRIANLEEMSNIEIQWFAKILKELIRKYDNLFEISFPYTSGIHQSPTNGNNYDYWHFHMHFYPPLITYSRQKFVSGYELFSELQRDMTPEKSAHILKIS